MEIGAIIFKMLERIKNFLYADLTHTKKEMDQMIVRVHLIIGVILLANCYFNYEAGVQVLAVFDLVSGVVILCLYIFRKLIPLHISAIAIFVIIILLNYFIIETMGPKTGNIFYFMVLPLGFSLIFQRFHKNNTFILFILSGLAMLLSIMWDNPWIDPINVNSDTIERKYFINITISFVLAGMFIYRYIRYYSITNEVLLKDNEEKKTLLREIHHRVKNNLNIILGLIQIQRMDLPDDEKHEYLAHIESRIYAIAKVHEMLFIDDKIENHIAIHKYINDLATEIVKSSSYDIDLTIEIDDDIELNFDHTIPIGLIINELMLNSIEHSFTDKKNKHQIYISLQKTEESISLTYNDSGAPFDYESNKGSGVGLSLIETLSQQLQSTLTYENGQYYLRWPLEID